MRDTNMPSESEETELCASSLRGSNRQRRNSPHRQGNDNGGADYDPRDRRRNMDRRRDTPRHEHRLTDDRDRDRDRQRDNPRSGPHRNDPRNDASPPREHRQQNGHTSRQSRYEDDELPPLPTERLQSNRYPVREKTTNMSSVLRQHSQARMRQMSETESESVEGLPKWSWKPMVMCSVSMTVFASIFGALGLMFAGLAYTDHKLGDYKRARYKTRWSWFCGVLGIVVTVASVVILIVVMYAFSVSKPTFPHASYWIPPWLLDELTSDS